MSRTVIQYRVTIHKFGANKCNVHFLSALHLILHLSNLMRFNLDHAVFAILFMCSVQEHVLDMVSHKCLCLVVSLRTTLFISRGG